MYAVFSLEQDQSNLQSIAQAISLLLFIDPKKVDMKSSRGLDLKKKLPALFRALSYETPNDSLALFKLPLSYRNSDLLYVLAEIPGYVGLVQERIEKLSFKEIKQQIATYRNARIVRYHFLHKRNCLQPVFFSLLTNSPFPLTDAERDAFSTWGHRTLEEERQLAEQFYQRIYATHVKSARKYLKGSDYTDPLLAPLQWDSQQDARDAPDIYAHFFAGSPASGA